MMRIRLWALIALLLPLSVYAQSFRVDDIRLEGLQRVSAGTVFTNLPVQIGQTIDTLGVQTATRALFRTGYFSDIEIERDENVLVIRVKERPAISSIVIEGNSAIKTEDLMKGLSDNGLAEGQIFKQSTLDGMSRELERQYVSQGRYSAKVEAEVEEQPRNKVAIKVNVDEGKVAKIKHLNIVGNSVFADEVLADLFELKTTGWLSWLNSNDRYSREKLTGDLEKLESYYLDRGYLDFRITSTQVSLSPDKETVFITANISEGDIYKVSSVELAGEPVVPVEELEKLFIIKEGSTFSQVLMTTTEEFITRRLGNEGYTFAEVNGITEPNVEDKTVDIVFFMEPGKRAYVRRIDFRGNTKTHDEVLRREMRQMEGASASTAKIEASKVRLERLGFFKQVDVETKEVPGTSDQVDVEYTVEEQPSGSIGASIGFAQQSGVVLGANVQQNNWFGTGKRVGFNISNSRFQTVYSFNYLDPYFTEDGVSRGFNVFYRARNFDEVNVSSYTTDTYGFSVNFGYPISEVSRLNFGVGFTNISIETGNFAVQEIITTPNERSLRRQFFDSYVTREDFDTYSECLALLVDGDDSTTPADGCSISRQSLDDLTSEQLGIQSPTGWIDQNGDDFNIVNFTGSWRTSTLNRGILATRGSSQTLGAEVSLPGGELEYFKLTYQGQYFQPLTKSLTLRLRTELGYGDAYGGTSELPFFENYYAGGFGSVRGFRRNTIGPLATPSINYITPRNGVSDFDANADAIEGSLEPVYVLGEDGVLETFTSGRDDDPFGGNILISGSAELLFPLPFIKDQRQLQSAFFIDAGGVYDTSCGAGQRNCHDVDFGKMSVSGGVGLTWITGFGPLTFSVARPIRETETDRPEFFQFSLGQSF